MEVRQGNPKMISKILAWLTDGKVSTWFTVIVGIAANAVIFYCGYGVAANKYKAEIAEIREAQAMALAEKEKTYRANERKQIEAYAEAIDQLEESRSNARGLRDSLERVRVEADRYRAKLSRANTSACKHFEERLSRCADLLSEGAELATEGTELSGRISAEKDAVVRIHLAK